MKFTLLTLLASASLTQATVVWDPAPTILTGDTAQIITGSTFASYDLNNINQPNIFTGTTSGLTVSGISSSDYSTSLSTFAFGATGFTLNGLDAGADYNVQLFYNDERNPNSSTRIQTVTDAISGNVASLSNGSFSTGSFVADASGTQSFDLAGDGGGSHFNLLVITSNNATLSAAPTSTIGNLIASNAVPEPTSVALLGLGGLVLVGRRKRA